MENAFNSQDKQAQALDQVQEVSEKGAWPVEAVEGEQATGEEQEKKVEQLTRTAADFMVLNIFRKHGVTKEKLNRITKEEKNELQQMMNNLQNQVKDLYKTPAPKHTSVSEDAATPSPKRSKPKSKFKARRRRNKTNTKRNQGR